MSDQLNDATTQSLEEKMSGRFDRLEALVISLAGQVSALQAAVNENARDQRDMYVDLRERVRFVEDQVKVVDDQVKMGQRRIEKFMRDQEPDSVHARFMRK